VALSRDLRAFHSFRFGFDITFVVEIGHPYKYIQESRFSARGGGGESADPICFFAKAH
jgi:hypothetical protein